MAENTEDNVPTSSRGKDYFTSPPASPSSGVAFQHALLRSGRFTETFPNYSRPLQKNLLGPDRDPDVDWDTIVTEALSFLNAQLEAIEKGLLKVEGKEKERLNDYRVLLEDAKKELDEVFSDEGWKGFEKLWTVGDRIKEARLSARFTQKTFATALGVTQSAVTEWEKNRAFPKVERLDAIAAVTDVEVKYIIIGDITPGQREAMDALRFGSHQLIDPKPPKFEFKTKKVVVAKSEEQGGFRKEPYRDGINTREDLKSFRKTQAAYGALANLKSGTGIESLLSVSPSKDRKETLPDVPVLETLPHPEGEMWITDNINQHVSRPKGLQENGRAYALYVIGHNAQPNYKQGEIIVVDPNRPPAIRDNVFVRWKFDVEPDPGHKACIGRLLFNDNREVVIARFKDGLEEVYIGANKVDVVLRIMPWNEVLGW